MTFYTGGLSSLGGTNLSKLLKTILIDFFLARSEAVMEKKRYSVDPYLLMEVTINCLCLHEYIKNSANC